MPFEAADISGDFPDEPRNFPDLFSNSPDMPWNIPDVFSNLSDMSRMFRDMPRNSPDMFSNPPRHALNNRAHCAPIFNCVYEQGKKEGREPNHAGLSAAAAAGAGRLPCGPDAPENPAAAWWGRIANQRDI